MDNLHARAREAIQSLMDNPVRHLINGEVVDSPAGIDVSNPAIAASCARAPSASRDQLDHAVAAAQAARQQWARRTFDERRPALHLPAQTIRRHGSELAALICLEQGKVLRAAHAEVERAAMLVERFTSLQVWTKSCATTLKGA